MAGRELSAPFSMAQSNAELRTVTPAVVAQRMADLLQCFPSAAIGGVQWHTIVRKYEEKHSAQLDLEDLGHTSALAAATALLWDVIRIVEADDTDNPVVAVEDAIALTPSPGALASWPSLYQVLCEVVRSHGSVENQEGAGTSCHVILLSQVKPLLQRHWHSNFDEFGLTYFTEEGSTIKIKKMKHLLQALLRWRSLRMEWRAASSTASSARKAQGPGAVDAALEMELSVVPSKKHNDLLLCCVCPEALSEAAATATAPPAADVPPAKPVPSLELPAFMDEVSMAGTPRTESSTCGDPCLTPSRQSSSGQSCASAGSRSLEQELALLRSENAKLRCENNMLECRAIAQSPPDIIEMFDDPFEPPPQRYAHHWDGSPVCSTPGTFSFSSGSMTPFSESSTSCAASGYVTPVPPGQMCNGVSLVPVSLAMPVWFQTIPSGVVQQACAMFEQNSVIPSWFAQR